MGIEDQIARRIHGLRRTRGLTLEQLAAASGVSRSMISLIERAETSPTATVLDKLADALGVPLPSLFAVPDDDGEPTPLATRAQQAEWTDPATGYVRRQVSPASADPALELVEIQFPPGQRVSFESPQRPVRVQQLVWMLDGEMEIALDGRIWRLRAGDCLRLVLDHTITFHNPTPKPARYALALTTQAAPLRGRSPA
ncbi:helix-turn-helix domain-containing protein [Pseudaquabacterium rugosum]|uniref:XRE family transcriptional regulator n=1 Tax=Pseudaquabacterium rugosum TaxID=2984194 RepID=A0ABU9BFZ2_9BURK